MRTVQDIYFDVTGQTLICDCPEGRPSSVTSVNVFRWDQSDNDDDEFTPTGTVETNPNTTTDAAAGSDQANPKLIPVDATTGVSVGRTYLLTSGTQEKEWVEVIEIDSGVSVTARHALHGTFASGSTFVSTRITAPVDATWVADESNLDESTGPNPMFRVRWVYVVSSVTYVQDTYCNLVRYAGRHGVTPQDVDAALPSWMDRLPTAHYADQGRKLIDEAHRAVKLDVHQVNFDDASIAESEVVDDLVRYKAIELGEWARLMVDGGDSAKYELAALAYQKRLDALIRITTKVPTRNTDGAARPAKPLGLTVR